MVLRSTGPLARAGSLCGMGGFWLPRIQKKRRRYEYVVHGTGIPCFVWDVSLVTYILTTVPS